MAKENCTLYRDKFITNCNENCYGCCNMLYDKYVKPNASTDKDNIDKFDVIEINSIKFVKENN